MIIVLVLAKEELAVNSFTPELFGCMQYAQQRATECFSRKQSERLRPLWFCSVRIKINLTSHLYNLSQPSKLLNKGHAHYIGQLFGSNGL